MSTTYSIHIILDAPHNTLTINKIFQRGTKLGLIYYSKYENRKNNYYLTALDYEEATEVILQLTDKSLDQSNAYLDAKFEDTDFNINVDACEDPNYTYVHIFGFGARWKRYFQVDVRGYNA